MNRLALLAVPVLALAAFGAAPAVVPDTIPSPAPTLYGPAPPPAQLIAHRLGGSSMAHMALLATPGGRDLLARAVSCALPRGASFTTIDRAGQPFTFAGALGLAPAWTARTTTPVERDRMTVCLRGHGYAAMTT